MHKLFFMTLDQTKAKLLDAAQALVQSRGHNAYSYRDLSAEVGITTAGIHYHYRSKDDLGAAMVARYREAFNEYMARVAATQAGLKDRLVASAQIFLDSLHQGKKVCVCAALAGEFHSLPDAMKAEVHRLIEDSEGWFYRFLMEGKVHGELKAELDPKQLSALWYGTLQGSLLMARASEEHRLQSAISSLLQLTLKEPL